MPLHLFMTMVNGKGQRRTYMMGQHGKLAEDNLYKHTLFIKSLLFSFLLIFIKKYDIIFIEKDKK